MLKEHFIECRDYIFNFLEEPMIPSDNNASERGIRKLKINQKISGTFRADKGADALFAIHTLLLILRGIKVVSKKLATACVVGNNFRNL
ncbi:IS66 family transposase [Prevotella nigrescens]|uniref:IS66 family transposase n=1 Tax=Prevotella nigrescens TaxID=28133 RepID=UPI0028E8DF74|nr:transposase [Prevotella nigrescens]